VVGHDTVGMDEKFARRSVYAELVDDPARDAGVSAEATPIVEAKRDEIELVSEIAFGGQADVFAVKFGQGHCANPRCRRYV